MGTLQNGDPGSPYSRENGDPGPHTPGNIGTRDPIFPGSMGTRDPHTHRKMGTPLGKWGPPVWRTIFWEFRDPQCDAGLSTSVTMNNMLYKAIS